MNAADEWIGCREVADEMRWTIQAAHEFVRKLGVPTLGSGYRNLRFRRCDYLERRDRAAAPLPARSNAALAERPATAPRAATAPPVKPGSKLRAARARLG